MLEIPKQYFDETLARPTLTLWEHQHAANSLIYQTVLTECLLTDLETITIPQSSENAPRCGVEIAAVRNIAIGTNATAWTTACSRVAFVVVNSTSLQGLISGHRATWSRMTRTQRMRRKPLTLSLDYGVRFRAVCTNTHFLEASWTPSMISNSPAYGHAAS